MTARYVVPPVATIFPPSEVSPATGSDRVQLGAAPPQLMSRRPLWQPQLCQLPVRPALCAHLRGTRLHVPRRVEIVHLHLTASRLCPQPPPSPASWGTGPLQVRWENEDLMVIVGCQAPSSP